ncbi:MAG: IS110 family transposase [Chitinophagales bacterium]|nr:IS110 family transposase [Chitinophagales bacterium]
MKLKHAIGIDVSKDTLDVICHVNGAYIKVQNNRTGFKQLLSWVKKQVGKELSLTLFCFEHTGLYSLQLILFLDEQKLFFAVESPLAIKRSMGLKRGKTDKVDAREIAHYAYLRREELQQFKMPSEQIRKMHVLLTQRDLLVTHRAALKSAQGEQHRVLTVGENKVLFNVYEQTIAHLTKQIEKIEAALKAIITSDPQLRKLFRLITSIKGIGDIIAYYMLVYTDGFTQFETWRQFACYCGIAPFDHQSGTSIKSGKQVHQVSNRKIKSLLFLAAATAIQFDAELKAYYDRRISEGKNRMYTLNAVKNKLVARIFAVVKRESPYVQIHLHAA